VTASSLALLALLSILAVAQTPSFTPDIPLKASDAQSFVVAVSALLSWPVIAEEGSIGLGMFIIYAPLGLFTLFALRDPGFRTPGHYFILAVGAWVVGQMLAIAYGRGSIFFLSSRYTDIYAVGLLAGCVSLLFLAESGKLGRFAPLFMLVWVGTIAYALAGPRESRSWHLDRIARESAVQELNVKNYLLTGDGKHLEGKPGGEIPFHDAMRLRRMLDDPHIRIFLPRTLYVPGTAYDENPDDAGAAAPATPRE
jgi:hypothetical protein